MSNYRAFPPKLAKNLGVVPCLRIESNRAPYATPLLQFSEAGFGGLGVQCILRIAENNTLSVARLGAQPLGSQHDRPGQALAHGCGGRPEAPAVDTGKLFCRINLPALFLSLSLSLYLCFLSLSLYLSLSLSLSLPLPLPLPLSLSVSLSLSLSFSLSLFLTKPGRQEGVNYAQRSVLVFAGCAGHEDGQAGRLRVAVCGLHARGPGLGPSKCLVSYSSCSLPDPFLVEVQTFEGTILPAATFPSEALPKRSMRHDETNGPKPSAKHEIRTQGHEPYVASSRALRPQAPQAHLRWRSEVEGYPRTRDAKPASLIPKSLNLFRGSCSSPPILRPGPRAHFGALSVSDFGSAEASENSSTLPLSPQTQRAERR